MPVANAAFDFVVEQSRIEAEPEKSP